MPEEQQADAEVKGTVVPPTVEYVQPPDGVPSIYANNVAVSPNPFDLRIYLGDLMQTGKEIKVLQKAEIIMSWVEAKIFANFLLENVNAFEKKNGPITFPLQPDPLEPNNPFGPKVKMTNIQTPKIPPKPL